MGTRTLLLIAGLLVLGVATVKWLATPAEETAATVWLLGPKSECMVTTHVAHDQKWLPCSDVPRHLRGTLHVPTGNQIAIAAPPNVPEESVRFMSGQLKQWGYTVAGVFPMMTFKEASRP